MSGAPPIRDGGTAEDRLGFNDLASHAFGFLEALGFSIVRTGPSFVRFESDLVFVNVYQGRQSYNLGVELGRLRFEELYSLHEVLSFAAPGDVEQARYQPTEPEALRHRLSQIAATIDDKCRALLQGDEEAHAQLAAFCAPIRRADTLQSQFGPIVRKADLAWETKEWAKARSLYEQSEPALDQTRRRRLEYLRKESLR